MPDLFAGLVDDAGLYPPEELPMAAALDRYRRQSGPVLSGRFLCGSDRMGELAASLGPSDHIRLGLICPLDDRLAAALAEVGAEPRLEVTMVEGPAVAGVDAAVDALRPVAVPGFVEVPLTGDWRDTLVTLRAARIGAKVRCGGLTQELFPTAPDLAAFVLECVRVGVPFKATAGLHHAVRYTDERTGLTHHGFLNLVLAVARAVHGADHATVTDVLGSCDVAGLVAEARSQSEVERIRAVFVSYGSCSTTEPVEDLVALGLVA